MKIYIVHSFGDEHKMWSDSKICGYYTDLTKLTAAVNKNREELGISSEVNVDYYICREQFNQLQDFMETGLIEIAESDEWN